ncbi:hypothetical protein BC628DRAFT_808105 [Trametes gibbosa]|nr:hypothetical protein BC628DRAFT_808105 [Trametes gibbosa]
MDISCRLPATSECRLPALNPTRPRQSSRGPKILGTAQNTPHSPGRPCKLQGTLGTSGEHRGRQVQACTASREHGKRERCAEGRVKMRRAYKALSPHTPPRTAETPGRLSGTKLSAVGSTYLPPFYHSLQRRSPNREGVIRVQDIMQQVPSRIAPDRKGTAEACIMQTSTCEWSRMKQVEACAPTPLVPS